MSRSQMTKEQLEAVLKRLKMPGVGREYEGLARQAVEERWTYEEYLHEALLAEESAREESLVKRRLKEANFPEVKTLDGFDFGAVQGVSAQQMTELARGGWVERAENVVFAGPIGTGKSHLAIALGVEAAKQKRRVLFIRAAELVRMLVEARDGKELGRLQRRMQQVEVLVVDELGFVPFERSGGELLFNVLAERYQRRSVVVTSNLAFGEWVKVFGGDEKLTTALLDRLVHQATLVVLKGKSYRLRKRGQVEPSERATERPEGSPIQLNAEEEGSSPAEEKPEAEAPKKPRTTKKK